MSQDITKARKSIAYLMERDMVEAHRRYSDVAAASRCCYEASHDQLLRSKSTSQLDAHLRIDGNKSLQLISSHRRPRSGRKNMTIKSFASSASSAMKPLVHHHDLQKVFTPPQCHSNVGKQTMMRFELQDKTAQPLLTKSKSTGWILNHHMTHDCNNKRSERRSPIDLLSWRKRRKTLSVSNALLEDSAPLMMMTPCSKKDGARSSILWRPLKMLFRWRGTSGKPSWGMPRSTSSSSSSCSMTQCAPEKNLHDGVSLPKLDAHVEPEGHVVCGRRLHWLLSQVRSQGSSNATVVGLDALHNVLQSSNLEERSRRRAGGEVLQDTSVLLSSSRVLKVAKSASSSIRESSVCSALSSPSPFLPSFTTGLDTSMIDSNSEVNSGRGCVQVSIAALISMDVNTTSPLKMAC